MSRTIDTLLLLALPASGKSELRRYLAHLKPEIAEQDLHLGPTVQLDDYPYVHLMRRIGQELQSMGEPPIFFRNDATPFSEPRDWGTLVHLVNEDYQLLGTSPQRPDSAAGWLLDRIDRARVAVEAAPDLGRLDEAVRDRLEQTLEAEVGEAWEELAGVVSSWREGDTVVIEFARGGPDGASMPLEPPHGYRYSLAELAPEILSRSSILYVWVTPEESRRRNDERARPGREGDASILHHGVPEAVMFGEYGTDDLPWLIDQGGGEGVRIGSGDTAKMIRAAVFDNRTDHTSFLREDPELWSPEQTTRLHGELRGAFDRLVL
ncbi:MAG: hypothetical protein U9N78_06620 [Actinomycetota bacterium]|nr:hypothetical protein [Actinomycetota bacterium]